MSEPSKMPARLLVAALTPEPVKADEVMRALDCLGNSSEWSEALGDLQEWTGSAFLSGEKADGDACKPLLYSFLCKLLGFLSAGEQAAEALSTTAPQPDVKCPNCNDANEYGDYEGPTCEVCGGTGRVAPGPSDTAPAEPVAWQARRMSNPAFGWTSWFDVSVAEKEYIAGQLQRRESGVELRALYTHPPRSVDVEAIKRALIAAKCDTGDGTYIHCSMDQVARSIAAMIEGNRG